MALSFVFEVPLGRIDVSFLNEITQDFVKLFFVWGEGGVKFFAKAGYCLPVDVDGRVGGLLCKRVLVLDIREGWEPKCRTIEPLKNE